MNFRRLSLILVVVLVLFGVVGYVGASTVVYNRLSATVANCSEGEYARANKPDRFTIDPKDPPRDLSAYFMKTYESVTIPSRGDKVSLAAWYVPAPEGAPEKARTVILVHGLASCKGSSAILMPAGMLNKAGYNVLLIDMRNHGASAVTNGRYAGGTQEYKDVLGAWDWLVTEKKIPPAQIGLFGTSLGAATVMVAMGEEPRVAATWEDSGFASLQVALNAELSRNGFPTFLSTGAVIMGQVISGYNILALSPLDATSKLNGRPVFITHGTADTRLSVQYASDLAAGIREHGGTVDPWIVEGVGHVVAMFDFTDLYEQKLLAFFNQALKPA